MTKLLSLTKYLTALKRKTKTEVDDLELKRESVQQEIEEKERELEILGSIKQDIEIAKEEKQEIEKEIEAERNLKNVVLETINDKIREQEGNLDKVKVLIREAGGRVIAFEDEEVRWKQKFVFMNRENQQVAEELLKFQEHLEETKKEIENAKKLLAEAYKERNCQQQILEQVKQETIKAENGRDKILKEYGYLNKQILNLK